MNRHHQQEINRNSHRSFSNYSHPNNQIITDHVHEGQQLRNSLKRPRESVHQHQQDFMSTDDDPYPPPSHNTSNKRFKGMKNYYTSNNNNHGLLMSNIKSDDEVSLAEETPVQTTTAPFPHHSSLLPYHQQKNNYDNQESSQNISSVVNVTDYQPMNSLLGNLHTIKRRRQVDVQQLQPRYHSHMKPSNNNHNQQQHNHHRHGDHSIPVILNGASSLPENRRSPKKVVSLRVNSNLY